MFEGKCMGRVGRGEGGDARIETCERVGREILGGRVLSLGRAFFEGSKHFENKFAARPL